MLARLWFVTTLWISFRLITSLLRIAGFVTIFRFGLAAVVTRILLTGLFFRILHAFDHLLQGFVVVCFLRTLFTIRPRLITVRILWIVLSGRVTILSIVVVGVAIFLGVGITIRVTFLFWIAFSPFVT